VVRAAVRVIHHEGKSSSNQARIDELNRRSAGVFFGKWSQALAPFKLETTVVRREGRYVYLAKRRCQPARTRLSADKRVRLPAPWPRSTARWGPSISTWAAPATPCCCCRAL